MNININNLIGTIRILNMEVILLNNQFHELMDKEFFNFDKAVTDKG